MVLPSFALAVAALSTSSPQDHHNNEKQGLVHDDGALHNDDEDELDVDENFTTARPALYSPAVAERPTLWSKLKSLLNPSQSDKDIEDYIPNYRYTPILSGVIIPLSILLEIPGLTEFWYVRTHGNNIVEHRRNPAILDVGLGFSMACALAANVALIIRFLERRVKLMTILCIFFLTIHDIINITAVTIFGVEHRFNDGFTYGQAFWVTVCSTAVSTITNISLITDLIRTPSFNSSGSGLTRKQRSLVIMVIILFIYVALGSLIHSVLEDLSFVDALYFTICTVETIGFGDIATTSTGGHVFNCFYAAIGIIILALAVSLTRETVLEALEVSYRKRIQALRERRRVASWRRRVSRRWREAIEWRLREKGEPVWVKNDPLQSDFWMWVIDVLERIFSPLVRWGHAQDGGAGSRYLGVVRHPHGMHLNLEALSGELLEAAAMEAGVPLNSLLPPSFLKRRDREKGSRQNSRGGTPLPPHPDDEHGGLVWNPDEMPPTHMRLGKMSALLTSFALAINRSSFSHANGAPLLSGMTGISEMTGHSALSNHSEATPRYKKSLTQQYDAFTATMKNEERKAFYARLVVVWSLFFIFWMLGSLIFTKTEGWSFGIAMYFCFIAFSTIGYGDFSPKSPAGRSIFVAWALLGVPTMTILVSVISEAYSSQYKSAIHSGMLEKVVKRYRTKTRIRQRKHLHAKNISSPMSPKVPNSSSLGSSPEDSDHHVITTSHKRVKNRLEALPHQMLAHAKVFHDHMQFFVSGPGESLAGDLERMPEALKELWDDIAGAEKLGDRVKQELLQDPYSRHTLFTISIERGLQAMIESAEEALDALEERDYLLALQEHEKNIRKGSSPDVVNGNESNTDVDTNSQALRVPGSQSTPPSTHSSASVHFIDS